MTWHDFSIRFVTPAFMDDPAARPDGNIGQAAQVPFPVASLRGVLRYWLRALVGAHVGNNLTQLSAVETAVFGTAAGREGTPSPIQLRAPTLMPMTDAAAGWLVPGREEPQLDRANIGYLLGQGLYDTRARRPSRRHVPDGTTVALKVSNRADPDVAHLFMAALWCLGTYGGLGARARRGFGTLVVAPPDLICDFDAGLFEGAVADDLPGVVAQAGEAVHTICHRTLADTQLTPAAGRPRYPALAPGWFKDSDQLLDGAGDLADALALTGHQLRQHRLDGQALTAEYRTIVRPFLDGERTLTDRFRLGAFGLPAPFSDSHRPGRGRRTAIIDVTLDNRQARRASPLWLRVYRDGDEWYLRCLAFLSEWLPYDARLRILDRSTNPASDEYVRKPSMSVDLPTQADVDAELRGWFTGGRPTPAPQQSHQPDPPPAAESSPPAVPRPGPKPRPWPGPRPGP